MGKNNSNKQDGRRNISSEDPKGDVSAQNNIKEEIENAGEEKSAEEKSSTADSSVAGLSELNDKYVRLYADFENYRKRVSKERIELMKYAGEEIFSKIIPVLDDFERAFKSMNSVTDLTILKQGEELIYNKFKNILTQSGLEEMKSAGETFDPELHDAVTNIPAPTEDMKGKVVEEVEKGYYLNGKVIRHAKVVVGN